MLGIKSSTSCNKNLMAAESFSYGCKNNSDKVSQVAYSLLYHATDLLGKSVLLIAAWQATNRYKSPHISSQFISTTGHLALSALWGEGYTAQAESTFFETLGGANLEYATALTFTSGGGLAATGYTYSFGAAGRDILVTKSSNGTSDWTLKLGGVNFDHAAGIATTSDDGLIVAGYTTNSGSGGLDAALIKIFQSNGTLAWALTYGGVGDDQAYAVATTSNDTIFMAGFTSNFGAGGYDGLLIKCSSTGGKIWAHTAGGPSDDLIEALAITPDERIATCGYTYSYGAGSHDVFILIWDTNGTLGSVKVIGGTAGDLAFGIGITTDGRIAIAGWTTSFGSGRSDMLVAKLSIDGNFDWIKAVGGSESEAANALTITPDGGIVVAGSTNSSTVGDFDGLFVKLWNNGTSAFGKSAGGSDDEYAGAVTTNMEGSIAAAGFIGSVVPGDYEIFQMVTSSNGEIFNCSSLRNFVPTVVDAPATITTPNITAQNWSTLSPQNWSSITIDNVNPTILETCQPVSTTGVVTTGQATTGVVTTGVATTGVLTTGVATTGQVTTGVMTTGIATTGVLTTGVATTGQVTTGVMTTGIATTGVLTTGVATTGTATTGQDTTGIITTGAATSGQATTGTTKKGHPAPSSTPPDATPLIAGLSIGAGVLGLGIGLGALGLILRKRRQRQANNTTSTELQDVQPPAGTYVSSMTPEIENSPYGVAIATNPLPSQAPHPYVNMSDPSYGAVSSVLPKDKTSIYGISTPAQTDQNDPTHAYVNMQPHIYENPRESNDQKQD